jgi:hypothetical protein
MPRGLPGVIQLVWKGFWNICTDDFKIQNLYVKNIMFAYSLPMSTSTWCSDHCNGPAGYISGELKSEKHKYGKSPHLKKPSSSTNHSNYPINYNYVQRKILVKRTQVTIPIQDTKTLKDQQTPLNCSSLVNAIKPTTLNHSLRETTEFKIIIFILIPVQRILREVINSHHWNYYFSFFFWWILSYPTISHLIAPSLYPLSNQAPPSPPIFWGQEGAPEFHLEGLFETSRRKWLLFGQPIQTPLHLWLT